MAAQRQASSASQTPHISPAELSYLYTSLAFPNTPIRPDGRSATQFRPLTAETGILPGANGSARIGFADGTQAIVGVKAEVEKTAVATEEAAVLLLLQQSYRDPGGGGGDGDGDRDGNGKGRDGGAGSTAAASGHGSWVQMAIEIPGFRDDDALPVFLAEMMREALVGSVSGGVRSGGDEKEEEVETGMVGGLRMAGGLKGRLVINRRWHWRLYIDVLLLSQPLSYPLPLLSLTTHLALLSTKLPKLKSHGEEDPFFDDDWAAAEYLYPRTGSPSQQVRPPVTLLVISVADNIIFDPSREEIAVADALLAVSITRATDSDNTKNTGMKLLSIRTIDPPSRLTHSGVSDAENMATLGSTTATEHAAAAAAAMDVSTGEEEVPGVWRPRRGGVKRSVVFRILKMVLEKGGMGEEVLEGLEAVEVG